MALNNISSHLCICSANKGNERQLVAVTTGLPKAFRDHSGCGEIGYGLSRPPTQLVAAVTTRRRDCPWPSEITQEAARSAMAFRDHPRGSEFVYGLPGSPRRWRDCLWPSDINHKVVRLSLAFQDHHGISLCICSANKGNERQLVAATTRLPMAFRDHP